MCTQVRDKLNQLPGVNAQGLGGDRMSVALTMSTGHYDAETIRTHPLIRRDGIPKEPGISGTVCLDECGSQLHLASYYPDDVATVIYAAYKGDTVAA